jgi:hypothetical protein
MAGLKVNAETMVIFDLQGKTAGTYLVNNKTTPSSSMMRSQRSYVMKIDGNQATIVNNVR